MGWEKGMRRKKESLYSRRSEKLNEIRRAQKYLRRIKRGDHVNPRQGLMSSINGRMEFKSSTSLSETVPFRK